MADLPRHGEALLQVLRSRIRRPSRQVDATQGA